MLHVLTESGSLRFWISRRPSGCSAATDILPNLSFLSNRRYSTGYIKLENRTKKKELLKLPETKNQYLKASDELFWSDKSFEQLKINQALQKALSAVKIQKPTLVQELAISAVLSKKYENLVLADQTGTGKTLAYLLPVLQLVKEEEADGNVPTAKSRPRVVVLAPSRELSVQIGGVVKSLSHWLKLRCETIVGGECCVRTRKRMLNGSIDVVTATPGTLMEHWERKRIYFSKVKYLIIDEADTMMSNEAGFSKDVSGILSAIRKRLDTTKSSAQFIYVGATLTKDVLSCFDVQSTKSKLIVSPSLHKVASQLDQQWIDVSGDKKKRLLSILKSIVPLGERIMIFCNTIASCRYVDRLLIESNFKSLCYHGSVPADLRAINYNLYISGTRPIMVCTDVASRGLDLQGTKFVILFDFPLNIIDYIHRIGRTARAGNTGKVFNFIMKRDRVLANKIQLAMQKREPLEGITSSK
ncbi:uncharacterized protein LOC126316748 isoform X1 [Schistocerca gregaria]|uniref:uncharacterized protein LOC126316748 isoform X1 n=1 Tax=Schistocerca gregaria TaxID=7010 RepID=UPI00211ED883|nr:uncharacterized protein LOC126316748 isoform X1 [Schistocerca gregaria]XP_049848801.1 uncharacterized protein LOC126316748 isoform X1 [Schistocerca gregaria]